MSIGDVIFDFFANLGDGWALVGLMLVFISDSLMIPTVPEVLFVMFVAAKPTIEFGILALGATAAGELIGVFTMYYIVKHIRVPKRVKKLVNSYTDFLLVSDERVLFVSRFIPMIFVTGAFIVMMEPRWKPLKCAFWIFLGCMVRYGATMICCVWLGMTIDPRASQSIMIVASIALIALSFAINYYRKKKREKTLADMNKEREAPAVTDPQALAAPMVAVTGAGMAVEVPQEQPAEVPEMPMNDGPVQ